MDFVVLNDDAAQLKTHCIIVGVFEKADLPAVTQKIDAANGSIIKACVDADDFSGKLAETQLIRVSNSPCERILLAGCGKAEEFDAIAFRKVMSAAVKAVKSTGSQECVCTLAQLPSCDQSSIPRLVFNGSAACVDALYHFSLTKRKKEEEGKVKLSKLSWAIDASADSNACSEAARQGNALGMGINLAKELGNLPGNICTPSYLAEQAKGMGNHFSPLKVNILEESDMEKLGMGALLSVSKGSREPAKLIVMEWTNGPKGQAPVVLVGKGLTFDAGGISIKPSEAMDEMKYDMCGAASVFGTIKAMAEMDLKINVVGIVPSSENLPDGNANKPGDIVTSLSGQTIEILNTDAEGRLILCDALTYAERYQPALVIDIATLTGACVIALGKHASGLFTKDDTLANDIISAGNYATDRAWRMPLWDDYQEQLKSNFADMANVGGREGGSITAACFLARYTKAYTWAHLDIAGSAWISGANKGATGRPTGLLTRFLIQRAD
ncbi:MAG: leucyl aminopeptidase [Gammaproteobacteria bacterium]|nr:leucyl aminopeptidase [Gammaproteobacteria bacterium]MDH5728999.1 leucyl aminopeptidase [Gammaproteobacteria bacterium]